MSETTSANMDTVIGRLVVEKGLATQGEVEQCMMLTCRRRMTAKMSVAWRACCRTGVARQLQRLKPELEEQKSNRQIPDTRCSARCRGDGDGLQARQLSLDRIVAIKVLPQKHNNDPNFIQRFYDEGKAAAKLNHANIVGAYDVGQAGDYHYFVMEYVDGQRSTTTSPRRASTAKKRPLRS